MHACHSIHALEFDLSLAIEPTDAEGWTDSIKAQLLPVVDEVLDLHGQAARSTLAVPARIVKIELDLGTVFLDECHAELARRLHTQLGAALAEQLQLQLGSASQLSEHEVTRQQSESALRHFLISGEISWEHAVPRKLAHKRLFHHALRLASPVDLLQSIVNHPSQLQRLVQQYDTGEMFIVARHLLSGWDEQTGETVLDWIGMELLSLNKNQHADFWLYLLPSLRPARPDRTGLIHGWLSRNHRTIADATRNYRRLHTTRTDLSGSVLTALDQIQRQTAAHLADPQWLPESNTQSDRFAKLTPIPNTSRLRRDLQNLDPHTLGRAMAYAIRHRPDLIIELRERWWRHWWTRLPTWQHESALTVLHPEARFILQQVKELDSGAFDCDIVGLAYAVLWLNPPGAAIETQVERHIEVLIQSARRLRAHPVSSVTAELATNQISLQQPDHTVMEAAVPGAQLHSDALRSDDPLQLARIWELLLRHQPTRLQDYYLELSSKQRKSLVAILTEPHSLKLIRQIQPAVADLVNDLLAHADCIANSRARFATGTTAHGEKPSAQDIRKLIIALCWQSAPPHLSHARLIKQLLAELALSDADLPAFCAQLASDEVSRPGPHLSAALRDYLLDPDGSHAQDSDAGRDLYLAVAQSTTQPDQNGAYGAIDKLIESEPAQGQVSRRVETQDETQVEIQVKTQGEPQRQPHSMPEHAVGAPDAKGARSDAVQLLGTMRPAANDRATPSLADTAKRTNQPDAKQRAIADLLARRRSIQELPEMVQRDGSCLADLTVAQLRQLSEDWVTYTAGRSAAADLSASLDHYLELVGSAQRFLVIVLERLLNGRVPDFERLIEAVAQPDTLAPNMNLSTALASASATSATPPGPGNFADLCTVLPTDEDGDNAAQAIHDPIWLSITDTLDDSAAQAWLLQWVQHSIARQWPSAPRAALALHNQAAGSGCAELAIMLKAVLKKFPPALVDTCVAQLQQRFGISASSMAKLRDYPLALFVHQLRYQAWLAYFNTVTGTASTGAATPTSADQAAQSAAQDTGSITQSIDQPHPDEHLAEAMDSEARIKDLRSNADPSGVADQDAANHQIFSLDPVLACYRAWLHGILPLNKMHLSVDELSRILNWWLKQHIADQKLLSAILLQRIQAAQQASPVPGLLLRSILELLRQQQFLKFATDSDALNNADEATIGETISDKIIHAATSQVQALSAMNLQDGSDSDLTVILFGTSPYRDGQQTVQQSAPPASIEHTADQGNRENFVMAQLADILAGRRSIQQLPALLQLDLTCLIGLSAAQLHRLILAWVNFSFDQDFAEAFLHSVEHHALRAGASQRLLLAVLQNLLDRQPVDVEQLVASCMPATDQTDQTHQAPPIAFADLLARMLNDPGMNLEPAASWSQDDPGWRSITPLMENSALQFWLCDWIDTGELQQRAKSPGTLQQLTGHDRQATAQVLTVVVKAILANAMKPGLQYCVDILQTYFGIPVSLQAQLPDPAASAPVPAPVHQTYFEECVQYFNAVAGSPARRAAQEPRLAPAAERSAAIESPLPRSVRDQLPAQLAQAMLVARLDSLDAIWPELTGYHSNLLIQAQLRYLVRPALRNAMIDNNDPDKLFDMLQAIDPILAELARELCRNWNLVGPVLAPAWAFEVFERELLRACFTLIFDQQIYTSNRAVQAQALLRAMMNPGQPKSTLAERTKMRELFYQLPQALAPHWTAVLRLLHIRDTVADLARQIVSKTDAVSGPSISTRESTLARVDAQYIGSALFDDLLGQDLNDTFATFDAQHLLPVLDRLLGETQAATLRSHYLDQIAPQAQHEFWQKYASELQGTVEPNPDKVALAQRVDFDSFANQREQAFQQLVQSRSNSPSNSRANWQSELGQHMRGPIDQDHAPSQGPSQNQYTPTQVEARLTYCLFLLQRPTSLTSGEIIYARYAWTLLLQQAPTGLLQLTEVLQIPGSIERLSQVLDHVDLLRLLGILVPNLAAQLPTICALLQETLGQQLNDAAGAPLTSTCCAVYRAEFSSPRCATLRQFTLRLLQQLESAAPSASSDAADVEYRLERSVPAYLNRKQLRQPQGEPTWSTTQDPNLPALTKDVDSPPGVSERRPSRNAQDAIAPTSSDSPIHNAGLVLVAPYIPRLFTILELTADGKFVDAQAADRAVHLLQYIVTGESHTPEYLLVLNKLLCGIHGGVPLTGGINMTEQEIEVVDQMLHGIINNWSAIGNTSVAGLRQTFLLRGGQLRMRDDAWHLKVDPATFDMLLDRLPWSFSTIKFPWMVEALHVTWR